MRRDTPEERRPMGETTIQRKRQDVRRAYLGVVSMIESGQAENDPDLFGKVLQDATKVGLDYIRCQYGLTHPTASL